MTKSPLMTENVTTFQQSARTAGPLNMVILHHAATTSADQVVQMMVSGSRQVSAHAVVKDGRRIGVVDETQRAWSLADAYWDSRAFTVECANESTNGWTISAASHESLAQLTADWARRYNFPIIRGAGIPRTQWTLLGHREVYEIYGDSYATACPGGMDLDWIAVRANQILTSTAGGGSTPIGTDDDEMISDETKKYMESTFATKVDLRRESRGRLFYCPNPPAGLPQFVLIFAQRNPGAGNVLYANGGEAQVNNWGTLYGQTADSVAQAKAAPDTPEQFRTRINLALGVDSAYTNSAAAK